LYFKRLSGWLSYQVWAQESKAEAEMGRGDNSLEERSKASCLKPLDPAESAHFSHF
jgi:hypothetical protein